MTRGFPLWLFNAILTRRRHLLLADLSSVYVYSIQTSLLTRQLKLDGNETVSDFTISSTQPKHLFLASKSGSISKWDWTDGHKISTWSTRKDLAEINQNSWDETLQEDELICVFHHGKSQQSEILSVKLSTQKERPSSESRLLRRPTKLMLRNSPAGTLPLVLYSTTTVLFGLPDRSSDQELYIWREIAVTEEICSVDISQISDTTKNSRKGNESVDLIIGCKSGLILVYEDVLKALLTIEENTAPDLQRAITPRRLHWHRNAVESVKYSRDGNYLISGGHETVLVIWQLSTDRRQYLPHLASPILNLSVSPSGNSYALLLAENSAMVLSTSTLEPTASISGLGLPCPVGENSLPPPILMALDPLNPTDLLCATSPSPSSPSSSLTFLQTYSLSPTSTHISRQALARNSTTNLQTAPNGQIVKDPSLTHLQPTSDGIWLVTVEEWSPGARSLDALFPKDQQFSGARRRSREITLRVWKRGNGATSGWETNTRINEPHSGSILALAVNPARSEFATVGEDGKIRFWTPKVRRRDGQNITDGDGNVLHTWSCRLTIELEGSDVLSTSSDDLSGAALAFSDDGSALAVYFANNATAFVSNDQPTRPSQAASQPVSIFSSRTGALVHNLPHLLVSPSTHHPKLAFLGRNLVALSSHLRVWDLVSSTLIFGLALPSVPSSPQHPDSSSSHSNLTHLASYPTSSTFAIAFPVPPKKGRHNPQSRIAIFNPEESSPIFTTTVNERITALVPIPGGAGYVYADGQGRVTTIKAPGYGALTSRGAARQLDRRPGGLKNGLENMFGSLSRPATGGGEGVETSGRRLAIEDGVQEPDRSGAVTRALGGGDSWDTMPVRDLFEKVASAFARKPVAAAV